MELWDLYTEERRLTGKTHIRGEELPDGLYHLVVHIWIKNSEVKYLISQRSADRPTLPLMWECVGGFVLQGENSRQGAIREVKEEVGVDLTGCEGGTVFSQVRKTVNGRRFNDILDVWLFNYDGTVDLKNAETDEVAQSKWLAPSEIREMLENGELVQTLSYFTKKIDVKQP